MKVEGFIAGRLRFEGRMAVVAIAISFFIIIISVAVSSGFSREIRSYLSSMTGDILISNTYDDRFSVHDPLELGPQLFATIEAVPEVSWIRPAIYRAGIVRNGDDIYGAIFKGSPEDSVSLSVRIPSTLAAQTGKGAGDEFLAFFVSEERVQMRRFRISAVYDNIVDSGEGCIIYMPLADLQRLNSWESGEVSVLEVGLDPARRSRRELMLKAAELSMLTGLAASSTADSYSQLFDWLDLIDYNVYAILALMTIVAGFNMISGLLILLFRNIPTIGTLKSLGMTDRGIAAVFLRVAARISATGMLAGNAAALLFCLVQATTKLIRLNPENYFVSFVPVAVDPVRIIAADLVAFVVIMLLLLIPSLFISKIDPSETVKTE